VVVSGNKKTWIFWNWIPEFVLSVNNYAQTQLQLSACDLRKLDYFGSP